MSETRKASVYASSIIPASVEQVWDVVGPFDGIPAWLPIEKCVLAEGTGPATKPGAVRIATFGEAMAWEELVAFSDEDHFMSYILLPHSEDRPQNLPMPALPTDYKATITLRPVTEGSKGCFIEYSSTFNAESTKAHETEGAFFQMFTAAYGGLRKRFS